MQYQIDKDFSSFLANETTSTMDLAKFIALNVESNDKIVAVFSRKQVQGRGRGGNLWMQAGVAVVDEHLPKMNMADLAYSENFSDVLLSDNDMRPLTLIVPFSRVSIPLDWVTLAVGAAIWDALDSTANFLANLFPDLFFSGGPDKSCFRVKWPNDIVALITGNGYRKICGVLCETSVVGDKVGAIRIGIGLNFFEAPELEVATSFIDVLLKLSGASPSAARKVERQLRVPEFRRVVLSTFLSKLQHEILEYLCISRTVGQLRTLVMERSLPTGTWLSVNNGERQGSYDDIDFQARIVIAGESIVAGNISILKAPEKSSEDIWARVEKKVKSIKRTEDSRNLSERRAIKVAVDFGNTRMHFAVAQQVSSLLRVDVEYAKFFSANDSDLAKILRPLLGCLNSRDARVLLVFCSVKDRATTRKALDHFLAFLRRMLPLLPVEECEVHGRTVMRMAGLSNKYTEETLGTDRALRFFYAARKAKELGSAVAVMGAGTALTCEVVSADGTILESLIFPGFQMSLNALHSFTSRLPNLAWRPRSLENGGLWNTERSMMRGVAFAETGALLNLVFTHGIRHVFLSGGDAEHLSSLLLPVLEHAQLSVETVVVEGLETLCLLDLVSNGYTNDESSEPEKFVRTVERRATPAPKEPSLGPASEFEDVVNSLSRSRRKRFEHEVKPENLDEFRRLGARLENAGIDRRLDQFLAERFKFHSRDEWRRRILAGEVCIQPNAPRVPTEHPEPVKWVKHTYRTQAFDQIWFFHPQHHEPDMVERCDVIADDGDVVVFSKPGNMVIHAVGQYSRNTFLTVASRMGYPDAAPIHRIDRETSGILVCARSVQSRRVVADAFRDGTMQKMYLAVTRTNPSLPISFRVESPIGDAVASKIRLKLWVGGANAVSARTHFVRLADCDGYSLYACFPKTGRTNQIRIHLASVGAWIIGDKMYHEDEEIFLEFFEKGLTERVLSAMLFPRHMLHNAAILGPAELPKILSENVIICPIPPDFFEFAPLLPLLELAKIPRAADEQAAALSQIFDKWSVLDFSSEPVV